MVTTHSLLRINSCNRFLWPLAWHILVNFPQGVLTCSQDWEPLLSRFSHVQLCVTPETAAHQAPPFPGLSRQEHRSGLPFPPPMHESEKWKWSRSVVSNPKRPHGLQPTRLLRPWDFPGKSTGVDHLEYIFFSLSWQFKKYYRNQPPVIDHSLCTRIYLIASMILNII